jgi:alanine-glyoxylate transaminase / serine-glyoxylate transaminase / serine-pyruvate transaminase
MGPGPSDVPAVVLQAMARPTIGHLDPSFVEMMEEIKALLRYAFRTEHTVTLPISAPGSAGMETSFVNLVEPGDTVIVCRNGAFGGRMVENVERCGGRAVVVDDAWGAPVSLDKLETCLQENADAGIVAFVHAETSTGVRSDAEAIAKLAHAHDCLVIADVVTALGGIPVEVDEWGLDVCYSGTQKCLSCPPGLSPVTFSDQAVAAVQERQTRCQSWFMDLSLQLGYWQSGQRTYHHTAPVNALYGLHEALLRLRSEGLERAWARHRLNYSALTEGFRALGLDFLVDEEHRLPQLSSVLVPEGVDEAEVRSRLLTEFGLEIGAGIGALGGKVWRVGLMGYSSRRENVSLCLAAFEQVLHAMGFPAELGRAQSVALDVYSRSAGA